MDTAMTKEMLKALFDETICDVTKKAAGISLYQGSGKPIGDSCTVYASFERGFCTSVSFCAEEALFKRLTQYMMLWNTGFLPQSLYTREPGRGFCN